MTHQGSLETRSTPPLSLTEMRMTAGVFSGISLDLKSVKPETTILPGVEIKRLPRRSGIVMVSSPDAPDQFQINQAFVFPDRLHPTTIQYRNTGDAQYPKMEKLGELHTPAKSEWTPVNRSDMEEIMAVRRYIRAEYLFNSSFLDTSRTKVKDAHETAFASDTKLNPTVAEFVDRLPQVEGLNDALELEKLVRRINEGHLDRSGFDEADKVDFTIFTAVCKKVLERMKRVHLEKLDGIRFL